jgi:hypothetical protein
MTATKEPVAPICPKCSVAARLTDGREIYPGRPDLFAKAIWKCDGCAGYVGCHPGSTRALGTPADLDLRDARMAVHKRLDPLWQNAERCGLYRPDSPQAVAIIRRVARSRIYTFLALKLGIPRNACHTSMLDLKQCREAWELLRDVTYPEIRDFIRSQQPKEAA